MEKYEEKVQVEIFIEEDTNEETLEIPEEIQQKARECIKNIESNLSIEMAKTQMDAAEIQTIPFHRLSAAECRLWGAVCPHKYDLENYRGNIPIRVLQALEVATEKEMFETYKIYSEFSDQVDPILVGFIDETGEKRSYTKTPYLIARWGESLFSIAELPVIAKKRVVEYLESKGGKCKAELEAIMTNPEATAVSYLNDLASLPYLSLGNPNRITV